MSKTLEIVRANYEARQAKMAELRSIDEAAEGRAYDADETTQVEQLRSELAGIDDRIQANLQAELRTAEITDAAGNILGFLSRDDDTGPDLRSVGERFIADEGYAAWAEAGAPRGVMPAVEMSGMDIRTVTNATTGTTSGGAFYRNDRIARIGQDFIDRRTFLIDELPHIPVSVGTAEYVQDKTPLADMADKAAETTENTGTKPQAGITTAVVTEPIATVAHWANLTRQVAADGPQVQAYIDSRLRYGLKRRADGQSINGNGTAPNIKGLVNRSGILTNAPGSAEKRYITIRHSIRLMEDVEQVPEIVVVNPADAEIFDLSNDASAGLHAVMDNDSTGTGALSGPTSRSMWGLRQVRSTAVTAGTALLIDPMAVAVLDRQAPTAYMTDSHASNFTLNILTLLLELRMGLALFNPTGVLLATFNGTT